MARLLRSRVPFKLNKRNTTFRECTLASTQDIYLEPLDIDFHAGYLAISYNRVNSYNMDTRFSI